MGGTVLAANSIADIMMSTGRQVHVKVFVQAVMFWQEL